MISRLITAQKNRQLKILTQIYPKRLEVPATNPFFIARSFSQKKTIENNKKKRKLFEYRELFERAKLTSLDKNDIKKFHSKLFDKLFPANVSLEFQTGTRYVGYDLPLWAKNHSYFSLQNRLKRRTFKVFFWLGVLCGLAAYCIKFVLTPLDERFVKGEQTVNGQGLLIYLTLIDLVYGTNFRTGYTKIIDELDIKIIPDFQPFIDVMHMILAGCIFLYDCFVLERI